MNILFDADTIQQRIQQLGSELTAYYKENPPIVVILMNGGMIFGADLIRNINLPIKIDSFAACSYVNDQSSGHITIRSQLKLDVANEHILIIDDIHDSGTTLTEIKKYFSKQGALSVKCCVLLNKNINAVKKSTPDWVGFDVPDKYVVGYGLDSEEHYRNLPYIGVIE